MKVCYPRPPVAFSPLYYPYPPPTYSCDAPFGRSFLLLVLSLEHLFAPADIKYERVL